jgi:preprotein translocase subunit YajC
MEDLIYYYLIPTAILLLIWLGLMYAMKRKQRKRRERRRFGDR